MRLFLLMASTFTYHKNEKLKSSKLIEALFSNGKSISITPLKIIYIEAAALPDFPIKAGVSASRKNFKKAVDRNRIKRLLREAYRLHKLPLYNFIKSNNRQLAMFILYTGKTLPDYNFVEQKMIAALDALIIALHEKTVTNT